MMGWRDNALKIRAMTDEELLQFLEDNPVVIERGNLPSGWRNNLRAYRYRIVAGMNVMHLSEEEYQERQERLWSWFH